MKPKQHFNPRFVLSIKNSTYTEVLKQIYQPQKNIKNWRVFYSPQKLLFKTDTQHNEKLLYLI